MLSVTSFWLYHKTDEEVLVWQFFFKRLGVEAVQHVVVLYGRVLPDGIETAMVVGEYQSVGADDDTRTETAEVNDGILHGVLTLVQLFFRQLETILLHLLIDGVRQVVECPHAFVGVGPQCAEAH